MGIQTLATNNREIRIKIKQIWFNELYIPLRFGFVELIMHTVRKHIENIFRLSDYSTRFHKALIHLLVVAVIYKSLYIPGGLYAGNLYWP